MFDAAVMFGKRLSPLHEYITFEAASAHKAGFLRDGTGPLWIMLIDTFDGVHA